MRRGVVHVARPSARLAFLPVAALLAAAPPPARAADAPAPDRVRVGVGWKLGNGLGAQGAGIVVAPWRRLSLELQLASVETDNKAAPWSGETIRGWGVAPIVRGYLLAGDSTPHASAGVLFVRWSRGSLTLSQTGFFATVGPEWRFPSGLRLLLGVGILYVAGESTSNGAEYLRSKRVLAPDLEAALGYLF